MIGHIPPAVTAEGEPYWAGVAAGRLLYQQCAGCGNVQFPFQSLCRRCLGDDLHQRESAGTGQVISFSTVFRAPNPAFADDVPYTVALVELAEGYRMLSRLIDVDVADVTIGMPVRVRFVTLSAKTTLPFFEPAPPIAPPFVEAEPQ